MKKLFCFIFYFTILLPLSLMAQEKIVISGIEGSKSDELVDKTILKEAYHRIGYELIYEQVPAERALDRAVKGVTDGASGRVSSVMLRYPSLIKIPVPLYSFDTSLFSKNHTKNYDNETLRKLRVGIQRGVKVVEDRVKSINIKSSKIQSSSYLKPLFKMLENDRLDVVIIDRKDGLLALNELKRQDKTRYKDIKEQAKPFLEVDIFHYVHKKNKHLIQKLTKTMQEMEKEGLIQKAYSDFIKNQNTNSTIFK